MSRSISLATCLNRGGDYFAVADLTDDSISRLRMAFMRD
jgi:hypothetical protein